jgi:poly-D-alanine transfer protein DltD
MYNIEKLYYKNNLKIGAINKIDNELLQLYVSCILRNNDVSLLIYILMGKHEKLAEKLLRKPKNFTFDELKALLIGFGYEEDQRGRTFGSAVAFYNKRLNDKIMIHKPHPQKEVKKYVLELVIEKLKINRFIK